MHAASILIAEHDPAIAQALATQLDAEFRSVRLARSLAELKSAVLQRVDVLIADLETVALDEVAKLSRELHLPVICTHRVPDEKMWAAALEVGVLDVCANSDVSAIISSLFRNLALARSSAA